MADNSKPVLLRNGCLVTLQGVKQQDVLLRDGRMVLNFVSGDYDEIDLAGRYILPGFIDIHIHGHNGFDFTAGLYDKEAETFRDDSASFQAGLQMFAERMPRYGVTSCYPTTVAATTEQLGHCCGELKRYQESLAGHSGRCKLAGVFLEGSFINKNMAGAQNPGYVLPAAIEAFEQIENADVIRLVNVAPESGADSLKLIEYLTVKGIVVGVGHSNATGDQINAAAGAGLKYAVHFTNGPTGTSYKLFDGGGTAEAVLQNDDLYAELICDGFHINPAYILDIIRRKGAQRILGITDAMFVTGCDIDRFEVSGIAGRANEEHSCLFVEGKEKTLFGSCLTMDRAFGNLLNWFTSDQPGIYNAVHHAKSLETAVVNLAEIFSTNPATLLGLNKQQIGFIADENVADITVLDIQGEPGKYSVAVEKTFVDGVEMK